MTHEITPCTQGRSLSCVYNGLGPACGASERFDVVSDLLRVGPGEGGQQIATRLCAKPLIELLPLLRRTASSGHRSVLVFIKARVGTHSSAQRLARGAPTGSSLFSASFPAAEFFQREIRTRPYCGVICGKGPQRCVIPSHSSHLTGIPLRSASRRGESSLYVCAGVSAYLHLHEKHEKGQCK